MRLHPMVLSLLLLAPTPSAAQELVHKPDDSPVVRAAKGDIGMFFRFGGLASMLAGGAATTQLTQAFLFSEAGVKFALTDRWMLPIFFGLGLNVDSVDGGGQSATDFGLVVGGGFEYHFRMWRRISPFFGATMALSFTNPRSPDRFRFATSLGPELGIEFYWADRASLAAYYEVVISIARVQDTATQFAFQTAAGGGLMLTFYF
jgi:hypothetical protein